MEFDAKDYQTTEKREIEPLALKEKGEKHMFFSKQAVAGVFVNKRINHGINEISLIIQLNIGKRVADKCIYRNGIYINSFEKFEKINPDEIIENFLALSYLYCGRQVRFRMYIEEYLDKLKELKDNIDVLFRFEEPARKPVEILGEELYNKAIAMSKAYAKEKREKVWQFYLEHSTPDDCLSQ